MAKREYAPKCCPLCGSDTDWHNRGEVEDPDKSEFAGNLAEGLASSAGGLLGRFIFRAVASHRAMTKPMTVQYICDKCAFNGIYLQDRQ